MKITIDWLREYFDSSLKYKEILNSLNKLGFELKKEYSNPSLWKQIEIVKIVDKSKHANAEKLNLYSIAKKTGEILTIVCGDTTLEIGDFVPYAMPGIKMPSGITLNTAKIRGIDSPGMLCSASEIDLPIQTIGVLKCFEEDWGKSISEAYESEGIFEIELTPNKGDALSIFGVARILANADLGNIKEPKYNEILVSEQTFFDIKTQDCKGLACTLFQHKIKSTPAKIAKRLLLTEHSVLNIDVVDLTKYISHDIGSPMHVFDYDKIKNDKCYISNLQVEEEFETLTGQTIKLGANSLVFKSGEKIISWPSIIGGNNSKVDTNTNTILLETGVFKIDSMQRRKYGITTSASKKAEYGIDPFMLKTATNAFFTTLEIKPISQQYIPFTEIKKIPFNFNKVKEILGSNISYEDFKIIMSKKGYIFNENSTITPPTYKFFDITTENCIIEEFALDRYDDMESINLRPKYQTITKTNNNLSTISILCGFNECKNISLGKKEHEDFEIPLKNRKILNYSNQNYSILRGSLIPELLKNLSWHLKNQQKTYNFFEYGLIYGDYPNKQYKIYTAISNKSSDIKNLFAKILSDKQLMTRTESKIENIPYSENASVFYINDKKIAIICSIKQSILKDFNIKEAFSLEIFPDILNENYIIKTSPPSNLSPVYQDVTFKLKAKSSASEITNILNKKNIKYKLLSIYPEDNLNTDRNITIQFKIEQETILTKEQINKIISDVTSNITT